MDNAYLDKNQESTSLLPVSEISISDLLGKINPADKNFLKYIPSQFLNEEQIRAKNQAIELEKKKYSNKTDTYGWKTCNNILKRNRWKNNRRVLCF